MPTGVLQDFSIWLHVQCQHNCDISPFFLLFKFVFLKLFIYIKVLVGNDTPGKKIDIWKLQKTEDN